MHDTFEDIRRQIHEIRNFLAPFDLKFAILEEQIGNCQASFEERFIGVETRSLKNSYAIEELMERVRWIESMLRLPQKPAPIDPAPVREDKQSPEILPPQKPGP